MVLLLDLDEDVADPHADVQGGGRFAEFRPHPRNGTVTKTSGSGGAEDEERPARANPNINGFSAALGCYPYALTPPESLWNAPADYGRAR